MGNVIGDDDHDDQDKLAAWMERWDLDEVTLGLIVIVVIALLITIACQIGMAVGRWMA